MTSAEAKEIADEIDEVRSEVLDFELRRSSAVDELRWEKLRIDLDRRMRTLVARLRGEAVGDGPEG